MMDLWVFTCKGKSQERLPCSLLSGPFRKETLNWKNTEQWGGMGGESGGGKAWGIQAHLCKLHISGIPQGRAIWLLVARIADKL